MFQRNLHSSPRPTATNQRRLDLDATRPDTPALGLFEPADVIYSYSRQQAIEDGVLVQLSGDGYEGDDWIPNMVAEAGFRVPVAMTTEVFLQYVVPTPAAERACNDVKGRLWDVLHMLRCAISRGSDRSQIIFELRVVTTGVRPSRVVLKAVMGPGDDGEPVMTIMLPNQD